MFGISKKISCKVTSGTPPVTKDMTCQSVRECKRLLTRKELKGNNRKGIDITISDKREGHYYYGLGTAIYLTGKEEIIEMIDGLTLMLGALEGQE